MTKLRILFVVILTITFLLSLWIIPVALMVSAFTVIKIVWVKVTMIVLAIIWIASIRPWTMFRQPRFERFISDMKRAIKALLS